MSEFHSNFLALDLDNGCYDEFESYQSDDEEHMYDALNDETFGNLADHVDTDWERQHENFLRNEKCLIDDEESESEPESELINQLERNLKEKLNFGDQKENEINIENSLSSSIWRVDEAELQKQKESQNFRSLLNKLPLASEKKLNATAKKQVPKNILSVEELEKQLRSQKQSQTQPPLFPFPPPSVIIPPARTNTFVPILPRPLLPPPQFPALPRFMSGTPLVYNTPPPPIPNHLLLPTTTKSDKPLSPSSSHSSVSSLTKNSNDVLLTNHEKKWLLNVQFVQLNTLTPFIDDYYYYAFQEKKRKAAAQSNKGSSPHKTKRDINEEWHLIKHRMYNSIQFNDSLGKLSTSASSFMCPRKFLEFDSNNKEVKTPPLPATNNSSEAHCYRLVLLEIEMFFNQLLFFEDLQNPFMVLNLKRQKEIVEKQHLKEIETATNVEEALLKFQKELKDSASQFEAPDTILTRILTAFLSKERIQKFLMIRKGKSFILRLIKHAQLSSKDDSVAEFWMIFLQLNLTPIWKQDVASQDNQMISFYKLFSNFINTCEIHVIQQLIQQVNNLVEPSKSRTSTIKVSSNGIKQTRIRSQTHNLLCNQIGISCISSLIVRVECLLSANKLPKTESMIWDNLLVNLNESLIAYNSTETIRPYDPVSRQLMDEAINRLFWINKMRTWALVNCFVDSL